MATYKLMQDIEAEDKILGPLTLRQFIFALVAVFLGYIDFILVVKHLYVFLVLFIPPTLIMLFFAVPFGRDQPTEIWALAKLRFLFKPRKRIWDQSGVKELVTINVPKKVEHVYTDGLSQYEVKSRLKALANTIDSRGWAVKNVNLSDYNPNPLLTISSDRLVDMSSIPQAVPDEPVTATDDMLDERNNPIAQQFDTMIAQSAQIHRQQLVAQLSGQPAAQVAYDPWFTTGAQPVGAAEATTEEERLVAQSKAALDARDVSYGHLRTLQPNMTQPAASTTEMTEAHDPAILSLANRDDLNIATLAREAQKTKGEDSDEVVVPLR